MRAVHFGAGNIGRGFIGLLLNQAGYHTTFVDVNDTIIREMNEKKQYPVVLADENQQTFIVDNITGINSATNPDDVIEAITKADMITTAVGPNVLPVISKLIAQGLLERAMHHARPVNVIACENMVGGSTLLKEKVYEQVTGEEKAKFEDLFGFPDAAVDRIVPNQTNENPLAVSVEPYYEWVVEETSIRGERPQVDGITFVKDLVPFIERKLFTVNTGHAASAYVGYQLGHPTIAAAMKDERVEDIILGALSETGEALIHTYQFDRAAHQTYIEKIIGRFMNPYISDDVTRVARGPIRKLGARDRLIRPAVMYMETTGKTPIYLAKVIAAALHFRHDQDEEAVKLEKMIHETGYEKTLQSVSELPADHPLLRAVMEEIAAV